MKLIDFTKEEIDKAVEDSNGFITVLAEVLGISFSNYARITFLKDFEKHFPESYEKFITLKNSDSYKYLLSKKMRTYDYTTEELLMAIAKGGGFITRIAKLLRVDYNSAKAYIDSDPIAKSFFEETQLKEFELCKGTLLKSIQNYETDPSLATQNAKWYMSRIKTAADVYNFGEAKEEQQKSDFENLTEFLKSLKDGTD